MEAIERDVASLSNDYKFKKLVEKVNHENQDQQIHLNDIYTKGWDVYGPWNLIVANIRKDFEDTEQMKYKIETLQERTNESAKL